MNDVKTMSVSELLAEDRRIGSILDDPDFEFVHGPDTPKNCLRRRREIRQELEQRHELSRNADCPTTDAELDAISKLLHV